jgi:hypothetical protein
MAGVRTRPYLATHDVDADGLIDLVVGHSSLGFDYLRNSGNTSVPAFTRIVGAENPLGSFTGSGLFFADITGDNVIDMISTINDGLDFYEGANSSHFVKKEGADNPFFGIHVDSQGSPLLYDVDNDQT